MAIQILASGDTPVGRFRRSGWLILAGMGFAGLGIFLQHRPRYPDWQPPDPCWA